MAESVSAANEVKLTEAEMVALNTWADAYYTSQTPFRGLYETVGRILGARLSAREPDNETVERRMEIAWNQGRKVGMEHGYETTGPHSNPYRSAARTAAFDYLATLKTTAPVETPPPAVPVSGVPTEAVRELAEAGRALVSARIRSAQAGKTDHTLLTAESRAWDALVHILDSTEDMLGALVQRAAEEES